MISTIYGIISYIISDHLSKKVYPAVEEWMGFVTVGVYLPR